MIEKNYNEALIKQDEAAKRLLTILFEIDKENTAFFSDAAVYHHFPIYPNQEGDTAVNANVLLITKSYGVIIFQCISFSLRSNRNEIISKSEELDEIDRFIFSKLFKDAPNLQKNRRSLKFTILPCIFLNNVDSIDIQHNFGVDTVTSKAEITTLLEGNEYELSDIEYSDLKATIEGSKGILKPNDRNLKDKEDLVNSKGAILTKIESAIYNFDQEQKRAALFTLDGAQRIRGLAGSGKTIILAMKAAQIHLQNPKAEILYTYYTKNLYDLVKRLITRFYRQFAEKDPNWDKIHIMHAWGGYGLEGVYFNACNYNNIPFINLNTAKSKSLDAFGYVCEQLNNYTLKTQYDYALLDEAQDFPLHFYRVCRQITKNNRVVWAYDDFQNILNINLQSEKETFGTDSNGDWIIDFEKRGNELQDLVLHKCYRNPKNILIAAFALGLGIYNKTDDGKEYQILQRLENNQHWESLGFTVEEGNSRDGDKMVLSRPDENSSELKNVYLKYGAVRVQGFKSYQEEAEWVAKQILDDLAKELRPEDISVICVDNRYAKRYFQVLTNKLQEEHISVFNHQEEPSDTIIFKRKNHVTLSTIYKAKGNEAGSVYIIGVDSIFTHKDDITERNKIFTAMTRALAWVTLSGIETPMNICLSELTKLQENHFKLIFKQPSEQEVKTIRQDINKRQAALNEIERMADKISKQLNISKEEVVSQLMSKLDSKK